MEEMFVLNLDKVRQGEAVTEGELLHKTQMELLLEKIRQLMGAVPAFQRQFEPCQQRSDSISHRRHHDAILLSGTRGAGKTTFLLSALHKLQQETLDNKYSFCVFEPVDPTLFGCNEHILLTLLSMIKEKVCSCRTHSDTARYCYNGGSECWDLWERQLKALASGLRTVGEQREDIGSGPSPKKDVWDDAQYLLEEGMDSARSSYELEYKLHEFINTSLKLLHKDAFVLGLDDVDTRPGIGWHVLEVLRRYMTTPQLIVIVSGNLELFQKLVERQQLKNFGLDFSSTKEVLQKFSSQVLELTNQYLLKILRMPLRIELLPFYDVLERAALEKKAEDKPFFDIDDECVIERYGRKTSLSDLLNILYNALHCNNSSNLKAVFRKALLTNSARTVLQIAEQLIELQSGGQEDRRITRSHQVADILRIAFLGTSGIVQSQEYFERLREGVGIEEITRLLLADKLPGDASLLPVHRDLTSNNSLLALTSGLTAAVTSNIGIFFIYFFKVCFAFQVLEGRQSSTINIALGETSLNSFAFRCSSLQYGDCRRPGWRAPGILAVYSASAGKNIPERARFIYGDSIKELLKDASPSITWPAALQPFISRVCKEFPIPQLRGYVLTTPESLQNDIRSWHREIIPHGFYEIAYPEGNYRFFSIWGLLGLMAELLICNTSEEIFDILFRKARIVTLQQDYPSVYRAFIDPRKAASMDEDADEDSAGTTLEEENNITDEQTTFIRMILIWKRFYSTHAVLQFTPQLLAVRIFDRFLRGVERMDSINSKDIFLGEYIHRVLVILFNSVLIEEYLSSSNDYNESDERGKLNLTTPLSSDDIFINNIDYILNIHKPFESAQKYIRKKFPLTRIVMSCPLWRLYLNIEKEELIDRMRRFTFITQNTMSSFSNFYGLRLPDVDYGINNASFTSLYYILNTVALQRRVGLSQKEIHKEIAQLTELGKLYKMPSGVRSRKSLLAQKIIKAIREQKNLQEEYGSRIENLDYLELIQLLSCFYNKMPDEWRTPQFLMALKPFLIEENRKAR